MLRLARGQVESLFNELLPLEIRELPELETPRQEPEFYEATGTVPTRRSRAA
jgi:hypothetical protein